MPEGQAPDLKALQAENERLKHDLDTCSSHNAIHQLRVKELTTALAESERKRVEAERDLRVCRERVIQVMDRRDAMRGVIRTLEAANKQHVEMLEAMRDRLCSVADFASTPPQETPDDQG
ncbi:hypothetical protein [Methylobacterium sp. Gmos1]